MENFVGQVSDMNNSLNSNPGQSSSSMSNGTGAFTAAKETERPPSWQLDLIMEKLRQKSNQLKPLGETAKNIRMALAERRCFLDQNDRVHFQKCLDSLQQSIKVNSLQSMVERLEMVSRQLGLKFTPGATGNEWFISSDMFYLELLIDPMGIVQEVKIQHDGKTEQQNVPEMVAGLRKNDFADFTAHLEGLVAIYQLNADKKIKSKAFIALQALEADLAALSNTYSHFTDGETIVMKSLFGLFQPRKGGHPVKLTYFISPYEFLDISSKVTLPTDVQTIIERKLGSRAIVSIQASTSRKLQMSSTVSITKSPDGKNIPSYGTLNATNSTALPACFTVNLGKAIPICKELLHAIEKTTGIHCFDFSNPQPILSLVTQHASNGTLDCANNRGLFVALPDTPNTLQVHCYFMTETPKLEGIMASSISFTLASQLPQIIAILRQQVIFNTLVGSCIRVGCKPDMDCMVFEVNALSHQNVSVSFQHPLEDSLVTLEFDLRDVSHPQCRLHAVTNVADIIPTLEEHACKVVQRSLSIPITVRAVIRRWQTMKSKYEPPNPEFNVPVGGSQFSSDQLQSNEISCGAESERAQQQQQQQQQSSSQNPVPVVMSLSNNNNNNNAATGNINNNNNNNNIQMNSTPTTVSNPPSVTAIPNSVTPPSSSSGRHPSGSSSSSYTISPVHSSNSSSNNLSSQTATSTASSTTNFSAPQQQQSQNQNPMELLSSYMNPLSSLFSNQLGASLSGLTLQNLQNLSGLTPNMALQMSMLAQQLQNQNQKTNPSMLIGLLDQVGQRGRRRKRKGTSDSTNQSGGPPTSLNIQQQANVPRPSPSPSPKSPRTMLPNKSPKRRPSEGSDISDTSQGGDSRAPTPQTPLTPRADGGGNSSNAINLLMSEIGLDVPDPRWNIDITYLSKGNNNAGVDITPVGGGNSNTQSMENFLASKLLSGFGSAAAANSNNNNNSGNNQNNSTSEFQIENLDSDMEIDTATDIGMSFSNKFSIPKKMGKKSRDFPKRSISLDSHHTSSNMDDHGSSGHLQSFMSQQNSGGGGNTGDSSTNAVGSDFKPLVTPSLSITPVSTNSSMGQTTVNSLLAAIRPGIEIIPLPNSVQIPNSITVTPIHPKPLMMQQLSDNMNKKGSSSSSNNNSNNNSNTGNISSTSGGGSGGQQKEKKNSEEVGGSSNSNATDGSGSNLPKKKSSNLSSSGGGDGLKKERKRKASSMMASLLDEDGHPIHDFTSGGSNKQPKLLLGSFGSGSGNSFVPIGSGDKKTGGGSGMSVSIKNVSPTFGGLNMKKPGSPSLNRVPTSKSSSPTPKIGGKPSVSTLKSVSGSPKYPDVTSIQQQSSVSFKAKLNKERKGTGNFQGNAKIAKNLCMVGNQGVGVSSMMPSLKSINESGGLSLTNLNPSLLGLSNNPGMRQDANLVDLMKVNNFMNKANAAMAAAESKGQTQQSQSGSGGGGSSSSSQHLAAAAVAAQIQRSNSTGSSSGGGGGGGSGNVSSGGNAAANSAGGAPGKKIGLLSAVIDKLKSQHSVDDTSKTKDMSNKDYLKASSAITSDVMQLTGQGGVGGKKNGGGGNNTGSSSGSGTTVSNPGANTGQAGANNGGGVANNPEYMVKPGGQGLKMTLGKTKSSKDLSAFTASKFKHGLKTLGNKKGLLKLPPTLSSTQTSSSMTKLGTGLPGLGGTGTVKKSGIGGQGSGGSGSKLTTDKDTTSGEKKSSKSQLSSGASGPGIGSTGSTTGSKSRPEDEMDLTRKLFLPFEGPKFDLAKYQIPKKSSNSNNGSTTSSTGTGGATATTGTTSGSGNFDNSPKPSSSSPSSTVTSGGGFGTGTKSSEKDSSSSSITPVTKGEVSAATSSDLAGSSSGQSDLSRETIGYFSTVKEKDSNNTSVTMSSSSQIQSTPTTSIADLPSTGTGSILISSSAVETKLSSGGGGGGGGKSSSSQNLSSSSQSESTKIKLSSSSIGSSEIPFLEEMNKYLSSKSANFSTSASSPMNLSQQQNVSLLSSQNASSSSLLSSSSSSGSQNQQTNKGGRSFGNDSVTTSTTTSTTNTSGGTSSISFGEPDSTTNELSMEDSATSNLSTVSSEATGEKLEEKSTVPTTTRITSMSGLEDSTGVSDRSTPNKGTNSPPPNSSNTSGGGLSSIREEYISPESPDPLNCVQDDNIYKNTLTIPTTPKQPNPVAVVDDSASALPSSPMTSPDDDDQLIIDVAGCEAVLDKQLTTSQGSDSSSTTSTNQSSSNNAPTSVSTGGMANKSNGGNSSTSNTTATSSEKEVEVTKEGGDEAVTSTPSSSSSLPENISMPPPPPAKEDFGQEAKPTRPPTPSRAPRATPSLKPIDLVSSGSSPSATNLNKDSASIIASSPSSSTGAGVGVGSPSPVPSPNVPSPSPVSIPVVSVHIIHSPQPNSPALLRSPMVVPSPHSSHASPYPIDDDLMDEALIG